jgi:hypothetical protein
VHSRRTLVHKTFTQNQMWIDLAREWWKRKIISCFMKSRRRRHEAWEFSKMKTEWVKNFSVVFWRSERCPEENITRFENENENSAWFRSFAWKMCANIVHENHLRDLPHIEIYQESQWGIFKQCMDDYAHISWRTFAAALFFRFLSIRIHWSFTQRQRKHVSCKLIQWQQLCLGAIEEYFSDYHIFVFIVHRTLQKMWYGEIAYMARRYDV